MAKTKSVEPNIADLVNGWLKSYNLDYKLEQETLNAEIDKALDEYKSKNGGSGGNGPDAKLLLQDERLNYYPILIEYKGYKDKLVKFDDDLRVDNRTNKNEPNYKNINAYAVNGAVHYANAILHYTSYTDVIAIGVTGYKKLDGALEFSIGVYYVSKKNLGIGQEVDKYMDLSFLRKENFNDFIKKVNKLSLTSEELEVIKDKREKEIDKSLIKLNNDIYENEKGLSENDIVYLVSASIIATLGIPCEVQPLEKSDLKSLLEDGNTDGEIIIRKIAAFLNKKRLPIKKQKLIVRTLKNTLLLENINKPIDGESQLKRIFSKIVDDLGIYYKIGLTTDFTGKLFNEMYSWLGFTEDKLNDVVITPSYVANLLVRLARVDKDSYVWDFATGTASLLVAAMNEMIIDAKNKIKSPKELAQKILKIKTEQLLGVEVLPNVYMLAILNMILMGDGCSSILNKDSLKDFDGKYGFRETNENFPATSFVLNPPYSAKGYGMIFVEKALSMMSIGYAAVIIKDSAGSVKKAKEYNKNILKNNTLLASIKMPSDLFKGKSSVETRIYVFRVGESHQKDDIVKFIDFSNDGYTRTDRKKARINLRDTDRAKERYQEIVDLVRFGKDKLNIFTKEEYYEGYIDPDDGSDWNQCVPIDTKPNLNDFKKTVEDYLTWSVSNLLNTSKNSSNNLKRVNTSMEEKFYNVQWREYILDELFEIDGTRSLDRNAIEFCEDGINFVGRTFENNGIQGKIAKRDFEPNEALTITATVIGNYKYVKYQTEPYYCSQNINKLTHKPIIEKWNKEIAHFFVANIQKFVSLYDHHQSGYRLEDIKNHRIQLPIKNNKIDFDFIEGFMSELEEERINELRIYLKMNKNDEASINNNQTILEQESRRHILIERGAILEKFIKKASEKSNEEIESILTEVFKK